MPFIQDWNGSNIEVALSKGETLAVANPFFNLLLVKGTPFPPSEILQKLYASNRSNAFIDVNAEISSRFLGYYCDLQSIHSEDAITWSFFGTLLYTEETIRNRYVEELLRLLHIEGINVASSQIWLWRRIPHPDTLVSGGPEIDFGILTNDLVLLGEAKWLSAVGVKQGKLKDKDQFILRKEFFQKFGQRIFPSISHFILLGVSLSGNILNESDDSTNGIKMHLRDTTWESLSGLSSHPLFAELQKYLEWKKIHSRK
jgi:hypothetical protein